LTASDTRADLATKADLHALELTLTWRMVTVMVAMTAFLVDTAAFELSRWRGGRCAWHATSSWL